MASLYDTIYHWARRSTTFAEWVTSGFDREEVLAPQPGDLVYRLKHWPRLADVRKNADIYRTLSVMSHRPVNRRWILASSKLSQRQVDKLLKQLVDEGAVTVTDTSRFANPA